MEGLEFKFDTQMLVEGNDIPVDDIREHIESKHKGDSLLVVGDEELIRIHYHTNKPWQVLEYLAGFGEIHDVVIENMERQSKGLQG